MTVGSRSWISWAAGSVLSGGQQEVCRAGARPRGCLSPHGVWGSQWSGFLRAGGVGLDVRAAVDDLSVVVVVYFTKPISLNGRAETVQLVFSVSFQTLWTVRGPACVLPTRVI